jgi:hypothetical protein
MSEYQYYEFQAVDRPLTLDKPASAATRRRSAMRVSSGVSRWWSSSSNRIFYLVGVGMFRGGARVSRRKIAVFISGIDHRSIWDGEGKAWPSGPRIGLGSLDFPAIRQIAPASHSFKTPMISTIRAPTAAI